MAPLPSSSSLLSTLNSRASALAGSLAPRSQHLQSRDETSLPKLATKIYDLIRRQNTPSIIPTTYGSINSGPSAGTIVGIVLGSVGGFLICLWLIYTCLNFGTVSSDSSYTESVIVREHRKSRHGGSTRSRRASETVEVRRERSPIRIVRPPERVERIIVEERREERVERSRSRSRGGSDEVVVIEEHSPPRRKSKSVKEDRRESGYRTVDPLAFGGAVGGRKPSSRRGR
ncbi:uncharacterized protein K444DRAFT_638190 [Hyaloscypha bicolor E]|uniref:Uncharacterized protein n=1 Tax=Hyaloscypha bicolor E TaxID=1095630 RepID=A0A2J6SJE0_9HELO|nr:uncharacterized protein K444DRAFT_638190 [Hyaloscypha bicolor E]PMD50889.1 hypothetical protein K444DRAFT_638190 [Hyaloscypha bicolor E]